MDLTLVGRALRRNKLLAAVGTLLAICAGFLAGYSIDSTGGIEPRTPPVYSGASTVFLSNPGLSIYAAQLGGTTEADPAAVPENVNLASLASIYAWVVTGDAIRERTEAIVGEFGEGESLSAVRRTTQPAGDERFASNNQLPIFDVITTATSAERAVEIAEGATQVFLDYVVEQQEASGIAPERRVDVRVLRQASAVLADGGSSLMSSALVGGVVLFVSFLLIVYRTNAAEVRRRRGTPAAAAPGVVTREPSGRPVVDDDGRRVDDRESALVRSAWE